MLLAQLLCGEPGGLWDGVSRVHMRGWCRRRLRNTFWASSLELIQTRLEPVVATTTALVHTQLLWPQLRMALSPTGLMRRLGRGAIFPVRA